MVFTTAVAPLALALPHKACKAWNSVMEANSALLQMRPSTGPIFSGEFRRRRRLPAEMDLDFVPLHELTELIRR